MGICSSAKSVKKGENKVANLVICNPPPTNKTEIGERNEDKYINILKYIKF